MKTKDEILEWLGQHAWYHSFITNTFHYHEVTFNEYISNRINCNKGSELILGAFVWYNTKEGYYYWDRIDEEYKAWFNTDNTNKTMKQTIEIEVPEGKKAIWKDGKLVFEDIIPELPKTWEEFCEKYPEVKQEYYINYCSEIEIIPKPSRSTSCDKNILPSKEAAEAHLALMQLHQLRDCYRQGWVPDWDNTKQTKYCIENYINIYHTESYTSYVHFLAFQTEEIAKEFLHNFEELIRNAEDLIG